MKAKTFLLISTFLISLGLLTIIFFNVDPKSATSFVKFVFIVSIWYSIFSLFIILNSNRKSASHSLRRGAIIASLITGLLCFSALGIFNFLSALTFFVALGLIEVFFLTKQRA